MNEIWKDINGYEGKYQVSSLGRVRSVPREWEQANRHGTLSRYRIDGCIIKPIFRRGYLSVGLRTDPKHLKRFQVHRLVAQTFVPNPDNMPQVNHKDEDKTNNRADNLEWCTARYNANYGTRPNRIGKANGIAIGKYDLQGNLVSTYATRQEAAEKENVTRACMDKRIDFNLKAGGYYYKRLSDVSKPPAGILP